MTIKFSDPSSPDENSSTELEPEPLGAPPRKTPWDPKKIRVSTKPWSLRQAIDDIADSTIDLTPDFQRPSVWNEKQKSRLIESILLGIPLPAFYFNADRNGRMQIVDGVQRLSSITGFVNNKFELTNLEYLTDLNDKFWRDLEPTFRRRFHQTQIFVNVIEPETPSEVKFNIFKRINTGGEPLTAQEIRHALSRARSRSLLKRMATSRAFELATADALKADLRMNSQEMALRFIAFYLDPNLQTYERAESVDDYLIACTKRIDDPQDLSDKELAKIEEKFTRAMENAHALFGEHAFRKWPAGNSRRFPLNRSLFESWSLALADKDSALLLPRKEQIISKLRYRFANDKEYESAITAATADLARVKLRIRVAQEILS
ncbi:DUF262 domain-containing protein [Corallococcus carmarthensis]|uniref:DUF262 domain-containing protein n=1 Tax=Corallococcus carmarthensis TaxID=2316728 RepID=A0A3A8JX52_9BACT|nr:DUF262 domain-containing protein [Corallococcus carmarthensis]RKG94951.1 DUF262 domain-containing protein [Corallococcus carmarthensis]